MSYFQRENRELVNVDSCELLQSQFSLLSDFPAACALDFFAEVCEQLLPPAEPNEKYFRLLTAALDYLRSGDPGAVCRSVTYFSTWTVLLGGLLPDLDTCLGCGSPLAGQRAYFSRPHACIKY
jgi:DNA repair protein RecO (recombination protein O)